MAYEEDSGLTKTRGRPRGKLKEGKTISCYISNDVYDKLDEHCRITGQSKTTAIERAIKFITENGCDLSEH